MENLCLVTKLKGVVDNDNLEKLGVFRHNNFNLAGSTTLQRSIAIASDGVHPVSLYANGQLVGTFTSTTPNYLRIDQTVGVVDDIKIEITNMYYVTQILANKLVKDGKWNVSSNTYWIEHIQWMLGLTVFQPVSSTSTSIWPLNDIYVGMFNNGRHEGELTTLCKVSINGSTIQSPTAVFSSDDVKVYNTDKSTLLATYDGTDWTYPSE